MLKTAGDNWSGFFKQHYHISRLSSFWRSRHVYSFLKNRGIKSILELGAGTGYIAMDLYKFFHPRVSLLDNNPDLINLLKIRFPQFQVLEKNLFKFKTRTKWDLVYSIGVIEHFPPALRLQAIKIHRDLSSKYVLIIVPLNTFLQRYILSLLYRRYMKNYKLYRPRELVNEIRQSGLKIISCKTNLISATALAEKINHQ